MPLAPGSQLGPYQITGALGAGGMGEVYRARDTRLERTVAIKILPAQFSSDPTRKQRFEREAKTVSSLNHPHICVLHDIGQQDGIDYLVMECVEGETLAKRLEKGPLPLEQVLKYGAQIADALDKAHRSGVVHRDLKPGNIMLTPTGAKLLDFGLAKPAAPLTSVATMTAAVTQDSPVTEKGTIVGTFQYMSPEQVEGKELDGRSDIFSFGAVLYEMLTAKKAFEGKSQLSVASAILEKETAPVSSIKPMTPPAMDHAIRRSLAKEPEKRWQSAADLASELQWIAEADSQACVPPPVIARRQTRERIAWVAAGLLGIFAVLLAIGYIARTPAPAPVIISQITAPENAQFVFHGVFGGAPALSPDGQRMAFTAQEKDGRQLLWIRSLSAASAQPLAGTEQAEFPFWSPDSRYVGYFANGKLNRIDAFGGPPFALCDAGPGRGGTWSRSDTILFCPAFNSPLFRVAASGGVPTPVTRLNPAQNEIAHRWPQFLPDGKHFIFFDFSSAGIIGAYISSLDGEAPRLLVRGNANAVYAAPGYLLYLQEDTLMAQRFDVSALQLRGDAMPLAEPVSSNSTIRQETVTASDTGLLVYARGHGTTIDQLRWLDRSGKEIAQTGEPSDYSSPRISPDGKNLAVSIRVPGDSGLSIWVYDLLRGIKTRRTFDAGSAYSTNWSPDGKMLVFASNSTGTSHLYQKAADGTGETAPLVAEAGWAEAYPCWSFDGRYVLFSRTSGQTQARGNYAIWALPMFGDRKAFSVLQDSNLLDQPALSPDGKWLAYRSLGPGLPQVYIAPFPTGSGKWQVSTNGGFFPRWRRDGRELFYLSLDSKIMAAKIGEQGSSLSIGEVKTLFQANIVPFGQTSGLPYDVTPDGRRFVGVRDVTPPEAIPMTLVTNWPALLKKEH